ncbi:MAG: T9SS type A sorting domain-containing protein [Flavobacterium sp.]|nr:T9SS type A sorting domain-containing protein [Flavobacterium sp.]
MKQFSLILAVFCFQISLGQWSKTTATTGTISENHNGLRNPNIYALNLAQLEQNIANSSEVAFPDANGQLKRFAVTVSSNMHPDLAARFPEIKTYVGYEIGQSAKAYFSISPLGLSVMILEPGKSGLFIEPYSDDLSSYVVFNKSDKVNFEPLACGVAEEIEAISPLFRPNADDGRLRTFRLALSATAEYTTFFGGTKALALAAMNNTMTRVNGVFENDFSIRLELIPNTEDLIFTNSNTDPYPAYGGWGIALQNHLTNTIGNGAYDIGHVFSRAVGGGGNAGCLACVCRNPTPAQPYGKGSAYTTRSIPAGDAFDIDYVAHEMGHQFGANHTFTYQAEATMAQVEPGSGSTIMGYAGIAGANNLQNNSDTYFHGYSIQQVTNFVKSTTCAAVTVRPNATPTANAGADYIIPRNTPFMLTGTSTDADGDNLTYNWEQIDSGGPYATNPTGTSYSGPLFRSFPPTASPTRYFPKLATILNGQTLGSWEALPLGYRPLNFRFTVRDNQGANNSDDVQIVTSASATGFAVTSPNTAVTWNAGSTQTVTWNVGGTNTGDVNTPNVEIYLSTDGGYTYPILLVASTPNDGSAEVTVPSNGGTQNRIMVKGKGNIFFDVSNANFTIVSNLPCSVTTTWNGSGWSNGAPTPTMTAIINGPITVSAANSFIACNLIINSNFVGNSNGFIEVENDITVNHSTGTMLCKSGFKLIQKGDASIFNGTVTVERTTTELKPLDYTYFSSPTFTSTINSAFPTTKWQATSRYKYATNLHYDVETAYNGVVVLMEPDGSDDDGDAWIPVLSNETTAPARGYAIQVKNTGNFPRTETVAFTGIANSGIINKSILLSANPEATNDDMNLVGNPYPSSIHAPSFIEANLGIIEGYVALWSHSGTLSDAYAGNMALNYSANDYVFITMLGGVNAAQDGQYPSDYIASGQGFYVEAKTAGNLIFKPSFMGSNYDNSTPNVFFRNAEQNKAWISMHSEEGLYSQQLIGYTPQTTLAYDNGYEVKTSDVLQALKFYSIEGDKFHIQARPEFSVDDVVKVGYFSAVAETFTITADSLIGIENVYIKDKGVVHSLPYTFSTEAGEFNDRFEVVYRQTALDVDEVTENNPIQVYPNPTTDVVTIEGEFESYELFTILGQKVLSGTTAKLNLNHLQSGVYILQLDGSKTIKIVKN